MDLIYPKYRLLNCPLTLTDLALCWWPCSSTKDTCTVKCRCKQGTGSRIYMRVLRVLLLLFPWSVCLWRRVTFNTSEFGGVRGKHAFCWAKRRIRRTLGEIKRECQHTVWEELKKALKNLLGWCWMMMACLQRWGLSDRATTEQLCYRLLRDIKMKRVTSNSSREKCFGIRPMSFFFLQSHNLQQHQRKFAPISTCLSNAFNDDSKSHRG